MKVNIILKNFAESVLVDEVIEAKHETEALKIFINKYGVCAGDKIEIEEGEE